MPNHKRGRPPGAKTKSNTPGRKRAREYLDLKLEAGHRSSSAASIVATKFDVEQCQIFKDAKRHEPFLAKEVREEAKQLRQEYEARKSVMDMGPHSLKGVEALVHAMVEALKGNSR